MNLYDRLAEGTLAGILASYNLPATVAPTARGPMGYAEIFSHLVDVELEEESVIGVTLGGYTYEPAAVGRFCHAWLELRKAGDETELVIGEHGNVFAVTPREGDGHDVHRIDYTTGVLERVAGRTAWQAICALPAVA